MANGRNRARRSHASGPVTFPVNGSAVSIDGDLSASLKALEAALREKVLRSAAYAGAKVFYNEMRLRVPVKSGRLYAAIYHAHSPELSKPDRQVYRIGPNKRKAPHWHQVEFGHWRVNAIIDGKFTKMKLAEPVWVPAHPYVRPTYEAKAGAALTAMKTRMSERMKEVIREMNA